MPEIGLDELPICPLMRLDTVTNRNAKNSASTAPTTLMWICGSKTIASPQASAPTTTTIIGMSRSVRRALSAAPEPLKSRSPATSACQIVGSVRARLMRPAAVTAPAPM